MGEIEPRVIIEKDVYINNNVCIGYRTHIAEGSYIGKSTVIKNNVYIGSAHIFDYSIINQFAGIKKDDLWVSLINVGSKQEILTYNATTDCVSSDFFNGPLKEFSVAVKETQGARTREYTQEIKYFGELRRENKL